ncbi:MAG: M23 family metallopeptidase [Thermomicrobiales bacterium]
MNDDCSHEAAWRQALIDRRTGLSRRSVLAALAATPLAAVLHVRRQSALAADRPAQFSYPMALPGRAPGDGYYVRHGYATENVRFYPGLWHTGENWFALNDATAGHPVVAVSDGVVLYGDYDYPGHVVIVQHEVALFSMYGHLDYALDVAPGDEVRRGDRLGTVLARSDDIARSHLHVEIRDFYTRNDVNGDSPSWGFTCGVECPPGPGYWPIDAPDHPSAVGWRNSTHVIARRNALAGLGGVRAVVAEGVPGPLPLWSRPSDHPDAKRIGEIDAPAGTAFTLKAIAGGRAESTETSSLAYRLWYRIELADGSAAWTPALVADSLETGSDGRPATVRFILLPLI